MAIMATLMLATVNSFTPRTCRQLATGGTCAPMKTPVRLLRSECSSHPDRSKVSQAQLSSILICGSVRSISLWDIPKRPRSKSHSSSSRISPSQGLANRLGPENPPIGRYPRP